MVAIRLPRPRRLQKTEPPPPTPEELELARLKALAKRLKTEDLTRAEVQHIARQLPMLMGYLCLPLKYAAVNTTNWWIVEAHYQAFIRAYGLFDLWTRIVMPVFILGGAAAAAAFNVFMFANYESQFYAWNWTTTLTTAVMILAVAAGISVPYSIARKFFTSWAPTLTVQYNDSAAPEPEIIGLSILPRSYFAGDDAYFVGSSLHSGAKGGHIMMMTTRQNPIRGAVYRNMLGEPCEDHLVVDRECEHCAQGFPPLNPELLTGGRPRYSGNNSRILFAKVMECFQFGRFLAEKRPMTPAQQFKTFAPWAVVLGLIGAAVIVYAISVPAA